MAKGQKQASKDFAAASRRWEEALRDIEEAFRIGITVHDMYGGFSGPEGLPLLPGRGLHPHAVCQRHDPNAVGKNRCVAYCSNAIRERLEREAVPFVSSCWKGVSEVVVPVICRGRTVLVMFGGPFRSENGGAAGVKLSREIRQQIRALPELDTEARLRLARVLGVVGQGVWAEAEAWMEGARGGERKAVVSQFLYDHGHEDVDLPDLADVLHLSASRAGHLVSELFGRSFRQLLAEERIRRARALLVSTSLCAREIAERVGFANPYYFSRVFRQLTEMTPLAYRRVHCQGKPSGPEFA